MRSRSAPSSLALVGLCALSLAGCGGVPLDQLPDDATAVVYIEASEEFGFASWRLDTESCVQLPDDTTVTLNGVPSDERSLGGRGNNPLGAYVDVGCDWPSAYWGTLTSPQAPFTLEVSAGGVTLTVELSDPAEITRCDFPSCVSESPAVERPEDAP